MFCQPTANKNFSNFYKKPIDKSIGILYYITCPLVVGRLVWRRSSVGQSTRFIPVVSLVQIQSPLPYGTLEKRLNSPASHAGIHGFESHTCHHKRKALAAAGAFFFLLLLLLLFIYPSDFLFVCVFMSYAPIPGLQADEFYPALATARSPAYSSQFLTAAD